MANVEIEIDDEILEEIDKAGLVPVRYGQAKNNDHYWSANDFGSIIATGDIRMNTLIVEPKPDETIPFPDWMPKKWQWLAINGDGCIYCYEQEPEIILLNNKHSQWYNKNGTLDLCDICFDTSWVPAMPNGDWTKAKWRRRDA